ncbi:MAG: 50S ribosomal protein L6 [candidate division WOR-3 bacterium]|nr:50S ribosomal protein L6 [candidate division WOR-3 bacterium]MCX7947951.1 50S ribosomal protein L6 [candidate division WOR-3 bacterium]MDW8150895.1 50S ribosomal protein L6 [candidate division WOR-3 bacterium]
MSKLIKKPILVPKGVEIHIDGNLVKVKGPKGEISKKFHPDAIIKYEKEKNEIWVFKKSDEKFHKALSGTVYRIIHNMVKGVVSPYKVELVVQGTGYRVRLEGRKLVFQVGYAHQPEFIVPDDIVAKVEGQNKIILEGPDKEKVGLVAAQIIRIKPPDIYKAKGIWYADKPLKLKAGKAVAKK